MHLLRRSAERGHFDFGWLDTRHTFSFGEFLDRRWMGFAHLRVINEDRIAPGKGFGEHPHRDMEIVTVVLEGALAHRDSTGGGGVIEPGDVQRMSAGTGITHSEFNASPNDPCWLLQIWLLPQGRGIPPEYEQKRFPRENWKGVLLPIVSSDGRKGSMKMHQQAVVYASILPPGTVVQRAAPQKSGFWLQMIRGQADCDGTMLYAGDGLGISEVEALRIEAKEEAEFLLFEMW